MRATGILVRALLSMASLSMALSGCRGTESPAPAPSTTPVASAPQQADMLRFMRAFPFPHSNVIFDTQSRDPESQEKKKSSTVTSICQEENAASPRSPDVI